MDRSARVESGSIKDKADGVNPFAGNGSRLAFNVLSIVFLISIVTLMTMIFLPRMRRNIYQRDKSIDHVDTVDEVVVVIPDRGEIPIDPEPVPENPEEEERSPAWKELKPREPHPEELDEDDLPALYKGLNPRRKIKRVLYRLAEWIHPISYDVTLTVQVKGHQGAKESALKGYATIKFKVDGDPSNLLEIHGEFFKEMNFGSLTYGADQPVETIRQFYNEEKRTYVFLMEQPLKDGEIYTLNVNWRASINRGITGIYETWYLDGQTRQYSLVSHGEPMSTRKWMPCFDEPAMKAPLRLTINHPSEMTARSNSPVKSTRFIEEQNMTKTEFHPTKPISTYLYTFSVTDYVSKNEIVQGIPVGVPTAFQPHIDIPLKLAIQSVNAYLNVVNTSRVFDKIDFVFVPDHTSAVENVGHITLQLNAFPQYYIYVHEMKHNYFGNLITLSWWDEVWINEAFTSLYQIDAVNGIGTAESIIELRKCRNLIMEIDALRKSTPLKNEATTEVEARANFDPPKAYKKGPIILQMIRDIIGKNAWEEAIEIFLSKFAFRAVEGEDFLRTMREVASRFHTDETPLKSYEMARRFFDQGGFPLLTITRRGKQLNYSSSVFIGVCFINGRNKYNKLKWTIPVHLVKLDGTPYKSFMMSESSQTITVDVDETLILDPTKVVYYRTIYDEETYKEIEKFTLSDQDKDEIEADLLVAAHSGYFEPLFAYKIISIRSSLNTINLGLKQIMKIFSFQPKLQFVLYNKLTKGNASTFEKRNHPQIPPGICDSIQSKTDFKRRYGGFNMPLAVSLCPVILEELGEKGFEGIVETALDLSRPQFFHPKEFEELLIHLRPIYPNVVANSLVKLSKIIKNEFIVAQMIARASNGLDVDNTEQLRQVFQNAPGAVRQNRVLITRLFNERHAIETEAKYLGEKIEKALSEVMSKEQKKTGKKLNVEKMNWMAQPELKTISEYSY